MKRILALFLLLLMSAACAESAPLPYAIESGFLIFPAEDGKQPVPIAVKDGFAAKAQELAAENAYLGTQMNLPEALLPYVSDELTGGEELVEIYATEAVIVMHTRTAADGDVLRWAELDGGQYAVYRKIIGTDFWLQTSNAAGNLAEIFIEGEPYYEYRLTLADGKMLLHSVWGEQVYFIIEPHAICNDGAVPHGRAARAVCGRLCGGRGRIRADGRDRHERPRVDGNLLSGRGLGDVRRNAVDIHAERLVRAQPAG